MKNYSVVCSAAVALFVAFMLGCAKPPDQELKVAKASLDSALAVQANRYAPGDYKTAKDSLDGAVAEIGKQNVASPLKKDYAKAKAMLASAMTAANNAKIKAVEAKKQASAEADAAFTKANALLTEVKSLIKKVPEGKSGTAAVNGEVVKVETSLGVAQAANGSGDLLTALDKANTCIAKLDSIKNTVSAVSAKAPAKGKKL